MKNLILLSVLFFSVIIGSAQTSSTGTYGHNAAGGQPVYGGYNMGPPVMSDQDYRMACDAIRRRPFDDDKLVIARQVANGNNMTATQVLGFVRLFTFDDNKLTFAQYAFNRVVDQQNYYVVNDGFTFSSTVEDLDAYIGSVGFSGGGVSTSVHGGMGGGGHCGGGGGSGSGSGHGHGHGHGHVCNSGCHHGGGQGHGYGQNGYYGGGSSSTYTGGGNGMSYAGSVVTVPVMPMCGMCSGYHEALIICEGEFGNIAQAVCNRTFESDKLIVAKQAIGCKMASANQVRRLMGMFTFESTKLDFAKWAYRHCWDAQNYYVVYDAFTFSSSVRELNDFIGM
jgi:Domain of unknown function (DUF4476)